MSSARKMCVSGLCSAALMVGLIVPPGIAQADPATGSDPATDSGEGAESLQQTLRSLPVLVDPVDPVDPGPDGEVVVEREPNRATRQIGPLPALDPGAGSPDVDTAPVTPAPPVEPEPLELPTRPAQELIDATAADALATLDDAGRLDPAGTPDLDANELQPQVSSAQLVDDTRPATLEELLEALLSGDLPPDLPVDPLALLEELPDGIPRITYRVCSESATKEVSCSLSLPLGVPAVVDVTDDGTPDVLADLLPAAALGDVLAAVEELVEVSDLLEETQTTLDGLLALMADPLWLLQNPWAILEALRLEELIDTLTATLAEKLDALLEIVHVGLAFLEVRLPTSEFHGEDLPAHVWAVYDIPGGNRLSVGYDGYRRGASLSTATLGLFTFSPVAVVGGEFDIRASLLQVGAGDAMAVTAGLAQVADTDEGEAVDPTVASARFSPVPTVFEARARVVPAGEEEDQQATVAAATNVETQLDTIVLANDGSVSPPTDRFVQLAVDELPTEVSADLTWAPDGSRAVLDYAADSVIDEVRFADFSYAAGALVQATQADAAEVPAVFDADLATTEDTVALDYTADSRLASLSVSYYDDAGEIVLRGGLSELPTVWNLFADRSAGRVLFEGEQALGQATVAASRHLGGFAPLAGDHATLVTADPALGISAQVTGAQTVDAFVDSHPRLTTVFDPGGQAFTGAGDLNGEHKARLEISNLPAEADLDLDTVAQQLRYQASDVIELASVAYTNTATGPTVVAAVREVPDSVQLGYELGDRPRLQYEATSQVPLLEFFASFAHIENLRPTEDHYLSAEVTDIPATIDVLIDLPQRHLRGELSDQLGAIDVAARFPVAGRDWTAMATLAGVPTEFDADWAGGSVRMRGITGPIGVVDLAASNHPGATAPVGLRLAAHYRESTGDIDAAVATRDLSHVEYADTGAGQEFRLDTDTAGEPVFIDVDIVLADPADATVDDLRLALLGRVDNLPSTLNVSYTGERLTYTADRTIGLSLESRVGKVAALAGMGAPLFDNGVAAVARACEAGPGCASDQTPFCTAQGCLGLVGTVNLPGLPTEVSIDTVTGTVNLTGYEPPAAPLQAYVRLIDLIDALPDLRAQGSLSGLPSPLDFTLGPVEVAGPQIDVGYTASAPLGDLALDADVRTTDDQYPVVRAAATVSGLPQTMRLSGQLGQVTRLAVGNSGAVDEIGLTVTGAEVGYLRATVEEIPAELEITADVPASQLRGQLSAPLGGVELLAQNMPFGGRTWGAHLALTEVPTEFDADWAGGQFRFRGLTGSLGGAEAAVTNHPGALAPVGSHLAAHYREASGDLDASAAIGDVSHAEYAASDEGFTVQFDAASQSIALDADVVLAAGGVDDTRLAALGRIGPIPGSLTLASAGGVVSYTADSSLDAELQLRLGKVAALAGLGSPRFDNGVSLVDALCAEGAGCADDGGPFCAERGCFGATGILHVSGLPAEVVVDVAGDRYSFDGYQPAADTLEIYIADEVFIPEPLTGARALVTIGDLPDALDFTLGPILIDETIEIGYESDVAAAATLTVAAEAYDVPVFGTSRARLVADPVPGSMQFTGDFGAASDIRLENSTAIDELSVTATGTFEGEEASARIAFTNVPAELGIQTDFTETGLTVPNFEYGSPASTLDGLFAVEGEYAFQTGDVGVGVSNVSFEFTDLGGETSVTLGDDQSMVIASDPQTAELELHTGVSVTGMAGAQIDEELFSEVAGLFTGVLEGHWGFDDSRINDLFLTISDLQALTVRPAVVPIEAEDLPEGLGWLFPGFDDGAYASVVLGAAEIDLNADIDLTFTIERPGPLPDVFSDSIVVPATDEIMFHRYDQEIRDISAAFELQLGPADLACLQLESRPGKLDKGLNSIVITGTDGQQMVNFLDAADGVPDYAIDLLASFASPFPDSEIGLSEYNLGSC